MLEKTYKVSRAYLVFLLGVGALFLFIAVFLLTVPSNDAIAQIIAGILLFLSGVFVLVALRSKIIIDEGKVTCFTAFGKKVFYHEDIKGYRIQEVTYLGSYGSRTTMWIESQSGKHIVINEMYADERELRAYFIKYQNLDELEREQSYQTILDDETHGATPEARATRLAFFKKIVTNMTVLSFGVMLLMIWGTEPYFIEGWIMIFLPFVALGVIYWSRGLVIFVGGQHSEKPGMVAVFYCSALALVTPLGSMVNLLEYAHFLWISVVLGVAFAAILYFLNDELRQQKYIAAYYQKIGWLLLGCFVYSFGVLSALNIALDRAPAKVYRARVVEKSSESVACVIKEYNVALQNDAQGGEPLKLCTTLAIYDALQIGGQATVLEYKGFLGAPFAEIER